MYKLIGSAKSRAFRVMWMLEELGEAYEHDSAAPRSAEALAVNPSAKVPAFMDGDDVIIDSVAICQYLADKHDRFTHRAGTVERARQDSFTHLALDELDGALWWAAKNSFVLPEDLRSDKAAAACEHDYMRGLGHLEARLGDNQFVTGDEFTVPDLIIGHCMGWGINVMKWIPPKGPLRDYLARLRERPAFKAAWARREAG
ncbi:MAG: glutathione S-transferase [Anderseniella sp.]